MFIRDPWWALKIWTGGMSSHGALLAIGIASFLFMKRRAMSWLEGTDRLSFSVALGAVLHRIGNFMNSELVGKPTDGSWGVRFPRFDSFDQYPTDDVPLRHPTQLYEAALGLLVLMTLLVCDRAWGKEQRPRGALTGVLLLTLFAGRILIELWKEPDISPSMLPFNMGLLLSLPCVAAGAFILWRSLQQRRRAGWVIGG
jgi:phosphatidylglycerol:prolipoprotein diacylglycerol transferase